jgi:ribonuclease P protein component
LVKRRFRLTKSTDFKRVRRFGKSYAHPLIVLIALSNDQNHSRFAVSAGRSLGSAVERNRAKRLLRECLRSTLPSIAPGWDILLLARRPLSQARLEDVSQALRALLNRADLTREVQDE